MAQYFFGINQHEIVFRGETVFVCLHDIEVTAAFSRKARDGGKDKIETF